MSHAAAYQTGVGEARTTGTAASTPAAGPPPTGNDRRTRFQSPAYQPTATPPLLRRLSQLPHGTKTMFSQRSSKRPSHAWICAAAGLLSLMGCAATPESAGLLGSLIGLVNTVESQLAANNARTTAPEASSVPLTDDKGGLRPGGVSDDPPGDDRGGSVREPPNVAAGSPAPARPAGRGEQDVRLTARLTGSGSQTGHAEYRQESGRRRFKVEVEGFAAGTYDVSVAGVVIGQITVGTLGSAELEWDSKVEPGHTPLPTNFPSQLVPGDEVGVGELLHGRL